MNTFGKSALACLLIVTLLLPSTGHAIDHEFFVGRLSQGNASVQADLVAIGILTPTVEESAEADVKVQAPTVGYRAVRWAQNKPRLGVGLEFSLMKLDANESRVSGNVLDFGVSGIMRFNRPSGWVQPYFGAGLHLYVGTLEVDLRPEVTRKADGDISGSAALDLRAGVLFPLWAKTSFFLEGRQLSGTFRGETDRLFYDDEVSLRLNAPVIYGGVSFSR